VRPFLDSIRLLEKQMNARVISCGALVAACAVLVTASPAQAQGVDLNWRLHGGVAVPTSTFGEYFDVGPTVGLDVGMPLRDRLDLIADLDFDFINMNEIYPIPTMRMWRYRAGLEADLLGDDGNDMFLIHALAGAGATTFQSAEFWVESRPTIDGEKISKTSLTGTGGLRLGLRTGSGLVWWLTGKLNWAPMDDGDTATLREASRNALDQLGSATVLAISLGFNLNR
jgi:hypothetical protein